MGLELQIQTIIFSFVYGMFFSLLYNLFYRYLFCGKVVMRIIKDFIFVIAIFSLFFAGLKIINGGIIHLYFIIMLLIGFIVGNKKTKKTRKYKLQYF